MELQLVHMQSAHKFINDMSESAESPWTAKQLRNKMNNALMVTLGSHGFGNHKARVGSPSPCKPRPRVRATGGGLGGGKRWTGRRSTTGGFTTAQKVQRSLRASFVGSVTSSRVASARESMVSLEALVEP
ncbi:hypothetical protein CRG98_009015 [Punica granatum]|uniref:Uncharacterized protein n=1 Tax=Punica granatum TaxID=22663 RepID=A0A2I0KQ96_PUNGR|nr:hypothetical protein CRG98_009015 [Punica granatum]